MTHSVTNIVLHRYQALIVFIAYTLLVIAIDRVWPHNPLFEAVSIVGFIITGGYLINKLLGKFVFRGAGESGKGKAKHATKIVP
jgi:hypothetical protein